MAERFTPDVGSREPIKPLRIRDEEPGGLLGILVWWRKRGGVFWWTTILVILTIGTLVGVLVPVSRSMGHLDFRPEPDITASISANKTAVSEGDTVVLTVTHENIGGSEAGAVSIDIHFPDELTATSVLPGTPACSQAGKLERFASQEAGEITGDPGGKMKCLLGTRVERAQGSIIIKTRVGDVADGANLNIDLWISTYRTDSVSKDEFLWDNNCASLTLVAGSGGQNAGSSTGRSPECSALAFVAQSIVVKADRETAAPGETLILTATYENVPETTLGLEEEGVAVDIRLPNELTAGKLQQQTDDKTVIPTCSHPNQLEEFASKGTGKITDVPGGNLTCIVESRTSGAEAKIRLETTVSKVVSGTTINVDFCARKEEAASAAPSDCTTLAVPVQEPSQ